MTLPLYTDTREQFIYLDPSFMAQVFIVFLPELISKILSRLETSAVIKIIHGFNEMPVKIAQLPVLLDSDAFIVSVDT